MTSETSRSDKPEAAEADPSLEKTALDGAGDPSSALNGAAEAPFDADDGANDGALARLAELEDEVTTLREQRLRALAEVENIRRRAERDRRDAETFGGRKLASDLMAVHDSLDHALKEASAELRAAEDGFIKGVELTQRELLKAFAKHKITPIAPELGDRFDPNQHQALFEAPIPGTEAGSVIQVVATGFMMADKLLRPAQVGVSSGGPAAAAPVAEAASEAEPDASSDAPAAETETAEAAEPSGAPSEPKAAPAEAAPPEEAPKEGGPQHEGPKAS